MDSVTLFRGGGTTWDGWDPAKNEILLVLGYVSNWIMTNLLRNSLSQPKFSLLLPSLHFYRVKLWLVKKLKLRISVYICTMYVIHTTRFEWNCSSSEKTRENSKLLIYLNTLLFKYVLYSWIFHQAALVQWLGSPPFMQAARVRFPDETFSN